MLVHDISTRDVPSICFITQRGIVLFFTEKHITQYIEVFNIFISIKMPHSNTENTNKFYLIRSLEPDTEEF